jgi:uncharacterized membrane protein (DUF485 family)
MEEKVMAERLDPRTDEGEGSTAPEREEPNIDWAAIEQEPEFQELVRARRSFVIPGTIFFLSWYMGFVILTAVAPDFMGESVYEGLTVGYVLALTQFLMVLVLGIMYLRKSENVFDPLAEKAIARYADEHPGEIDGITGDDSLGDQVDSSSTSKQETVR